MTNPDTDSLRVRLAERLGWKKIPRPAKLPATAMAGNPNYYWPDELPDLASLVAEAQRGLDNYQRRAYARKLYEEVRGTPWDREIMHIGPLIACLLITASPEQRAAALLEVLP